MLSRTRRTNVPNESDLDIACKVAGAKLGVAEEMRWPLAILGAAAAYGYSQSWLVAIGVWVAVYWVATYPYNKEYEEAWDQYEKATGTGKYYAPAKQD